MMVSLKRSKAGMSDVTTTDMAPSSATNNRAIENHPGARRMITRRYLMLLSSSTVFILAFSFLLATVPFVRGIGDLQEMASAAGTRIFRLAPWINARRRSLFHRSCRLAVGPLEEFCIVRGGTAAEAPATATAQHHHHHHHSSAATTTHVKVEAPHSTGAATATATTTVPIIHKETIKTKLLHSRKQDKDSHHQSKYHFSLYQKGDGSEKDPDGIPTRYLKMQLGNREKAKHALGLTLQWREENDIDYIIGKPHPDFDVAKAVFPHYFTGRDKDGHVVFVQRPAMLDLEKAKKNKLTNHALLNHYVYVNEYLWQILEAKHPVATMTSIIDLQGLNLSVLRQSDIISFLKKFVMTMDMHFPQRANITLLVNSPKWFNMLYKLISPLLRESTKAKIFIYSNGKKQDDALKQRLDKESVSSLPPSFWSKEHNAQNQSDLTPENHHDYQHISDIERDLREFTLARIKEAGLKMQNVV